VCLKERNFLLTERLYFRQMLQAAPEGSRLTKVRRTMAAIKTVLGERKRATAALAADEQRSAKAAAVVRALTGRRERSAAEEEALARSPASASASAGSSAGQAEQGASESSRASSSKASRRSSPAAAGGEAVAAEAGKVAAAVVKLEQVKLSGVSASSRERA
jgi:ribosomal protein L29